MLGGTQMYARPIKALGQNFLKNETVAIAEAAHSYQKNVLEIGPGYGVLTKQLCKHASRVVAVEKDANLCRFLRTEVKSKRLRLINKDFFKATDEELQAADTDIMIANVPYNLSSKIIEWLLAHSMQAVLCLQKEFVQHMHAQCGTENYSRLSVMSSLCFSMTKIMDVPRGNFYPVPRVDSAVIYIKPKQQKVGKEEAQMINLLMQHKNKRVRNALIDSHRYLGMDKQVIASAIKNIDHGDERAYKLEPKQILEVAQQAIKALQKE
ncbi:MAG: ribosomal RNA small subunit methyltransferase A [Candidatus Micrarchaeota archaeon]|nr:ribosomal RNA small subunit methyltransferase A [Candidatus Micrarchaeota archaeon]